MSIAQNENKPRLTNMNGQIPKIVAFPQNSVRTVKERELRPQKSETGKRKKKIDTSKIRPRTFLKSFLLL